MAEAHKKQKLDHATLSTTTEESVTEPTSILKQMEEKANLPGHYGTPYQEWPKFVIEPYQKSLADNYNMLAKLVSDGRLSRFKSEFEKLIVPTVESAFSLSLETKTDVPNIADHGKALYDAVATHDSSLAKHVLEKVGKDDLESKSWKCWVNLAMFRAILQNSERMVGEVLLSHESFASCLNVEFDLLNEENDTPVEQIFLGHLYGRNLGRSPFTRGPGSANLFDAAYFCHNVNMHKLLRKALGYDMNERTPSIWSNVDVHY